eukprot:gene14300-biopygen3165
MPFTKKAGSIPGLAAAHRAGRSSSRRRRRRPALLLELGQAGPAGLRRRRGASRRVASPAGAARAGGKSASIQCEKADNATTWPPCRHATCGHRSFATRVKDALLQQQLQRTLAGSLCVCVIPSLKAVPDGSGIQGCKVFIKNASSDVSDSGDRASFSDSLLHFALQACSAVQRHGMLDCSSFGSSLGGRARAAARAAPRGVSQLMQPLQQLKERRDAGEIGAARSRFTSAVALA